MEKVTPLRFKKTIETESNKKQLINKDIERKQRRMKRVLIFMIFLCFIFSITSCSKDTESNKVVIYSSAEDYRNEYYLSRLKEEFPEYNIVLEYMPTGNHAAKLQAEGSNTECDIILELEYGYLEMIKDNLANLSNYEISAYETDLIDKDRKYIPEVRNSGCIIVNTEVLAKKGLPEPKSYEDLLSTEYKGLISMPSPKASGTGFMFVKALVNEWGEDEAFSYFDKLSDNVLQYTSSGSGPVNALVQGEVAIGLGMTAQAVTQINEGAPLKLLFFEEGAPYSMYGSAIVAGKDSRNAVQDVFAFLIETLIYENNMKFFPEAIYKSGACSVENYPTNIEYSDMSNNSIDEKERLLKKWNH